MTSNFKRDNGFQTSVPPSISDSAGKEPEIIWWPDKCCCPETVILGRENPLQKNEVLCISMWPPIKQSHENFSLGKRERENSIRWEQGRWLILCEQNWKVQYIWLCLRSLMSCQGKQPFYKFGILLWEQFSLHVFSQWWAFPRQKKKKPKTTPAATSNCDSITREEKPSAR